jgi:lysophospholipase L1-like esterase
VSDLPERLRRAEGSISPRIDYVDLTAALAAAAKDGVLPYCSDDVHWSPEGYRIAAEAIHAYLAAHP